MRIGVLIVAGGLLVAGGAAAQVDGRPWSPWGGQDSPGGLFGTGDPFAADRDRDGGLTHDEVWAPLRQRLERADRNRDGGLSAEEMGRNRPDDASFRRADTNGDGILSLEELRAASEARFRSQDRNGDGRLTRAEMPRRRHRPVAARPAG